MLFVSYSYFLQAPNNWNIIPRLALAISLVESGNINIDKYHSATGDKAFFDGHYYSQAAPGTSFMAVPVVFLTNFFLESDQVNTKWTLENKRKVTPNFILAMQFATIFVSGLFAALTGLMIYIVGLRLGFGLPGAAFGALAFGLATPAWGWATTLFGHSSASAFLFFGFVVIYYLLNSKVKKRKDVLLAFAAGAFLSWAVVLEYTSAPASAIIAVYGIIGARVWERKRLIRVLLSAISGAILFIMPLLLYHYYAFGDPFATGYKYHLILAQSNEGFYGIKSPQLTIAARLLFGLKRGLLWFSPILILVPIALYRQWKTPGNRGMAVLIALIAASYIIWNSGYVYWTAGASTGPRLLTPILPFLCLSLGFLWARSGRILKAAMLFLFTISFLISLMSVSVSMFIRGASLKLIIPEYLLPKFLEAAQLKISILVRLILPSYDGSSHIHLMPLYIILAIGFLYILYEIYKYDGKDFQS